LFCCCCCPAQTPQPTNQGPARSSAGRRFTYKGTRRLVWLDAVGLRDGRGSGRRGAAGTYPACRRIAPLLSANAARSSPRPRHLLHSSLPVLTPLYLVLTIFHSLLTPPSIYTDIPDVPPSTPPSPLPPPTSATLIDHPHRHGRPPLQRPRLPAPVPARQAQPAAVKQHSGPRCQVVNTRHLPDRRLRRTRKGGPEHPRPDCSFNTVPPIFPSIPTSGLTSALRRTKPPLVSTSKPTRSPPGPFH